MAAYDERKARYCDAHGIRLCNVKGTVSREWLQALLQGGSNATVQEIPF